jgi:SAM-dependent methyltransferase
MTSAAYLGSELELFSEARNWKRYVLGKIRPFLGDEVLEVGAGMGAFAREAAGARKRWLCLEPDPRLNAALSRSVAGRELPTGCEARLGGIETVRADERFDSVVYFDVLEHVEDDLGEARRAFARLKPGGSLIVLAPAHQFLYTPFDRSIGHFRRYSKGTLALVKPEGAVEDVLSYLDSAGMLASLANRFLLRRDMPSRAQIQFWDSVLVRASRILDPLLFFSLGKSVLAVWRRPERTDS